MSWQGSLFGDDFFGGSGPPIIPPDVGGGSGDRLIVQLIDGTDLFQFLYQQLLSIELTKEGYSADIFLVFDASGNTLTVGQRFKVTLPSGLQLIFVAKTIPEVVHEVYHGGADPAIYVFKFACVDPLTYLANKALPNLKPFVNTTTGAILRTVIPLLDNTLDVSGIADGNAVQALNLQDFSSFGDLIRSEIVSGEYVLRMSNGLSVEGKFGNQFGPGEYRVDYTDYRYTPSRQQISPPDEILSSVKVIPSKLVPAFRVSEFHEQDMRVMPQLNLESKPFGLDDAEPLKLSGSIDVNDTDLFITTGIVSTLASHILLNGSLTMLDARPFGTSFVVTWSGIIFTGGGSFALGFTDSNGNFLLSVTSGDFSAAGIPLEVDTQLNQHTYAAYAAARPDGSVAVWGLYQHIDFTVSVDEVIGDITAINTNDKTITLNSVWNAGTDYIRVKRGATEIGRARIERNEIVGGVSVLTLDQNVVGAQVGDEVTRGVQASATTTIKLLKVVSASGFGLPTLVGSNCAIQAMTVQRTGQVDGKLITHTNLNPNATYPRDLLIDVDLTEFSDGQLSGSGSSAVITWSTKFVNDARALLLINYVVGAKRTFKCDHGGGGGHANVTIDNEQDPAVLQAIAEAICSLGSQAYPRVNAFIESTEVSGTPLPGDMLPVNLPADYQIAAQSVPIESIKLTYKGASISTDEVYNEDVILYEINAGPKPPVERVKDDFLRSRGLTKYPIRVATISGAQILAANWDDATNILTASVSGGTVYGPRGEILDLAGGIRPADVAKIPNPAAAPVTIRGVVPIAGRPHPDIVVFQVIYRPNAADPSTVFCRLFPIIKHAEFIWQLPDGAIKQNVYRQKEGVTGETDDDLELVDTVVAPGSSWQGAISKEHRSIWVESVGLCDKKSSKMKLTCVPARLGPPVLAFLKLNDNNVTKLITQPPPAEATAIIFVTAPTQAGFTTAGGIPIPTDATKSEYHINIFKLNTEGSQANHYSVPYDSTRAGRDFYLTAAWLNFFDEPQDWANPLNPNALASAIPLKPPKPIMADLLTNQPNFDTIESDASVEVLVRADKDWQTKTEANWITFDQANARGANVLYRHVRHRDRRIIVPAPSGQWTNPNNAQKSDDTRAEASGTGTTLTARLLVNGSPVGTSKSIAVGGQADQVYGFGGPGDFWGAALNAWTTTDLNTDGAIGVRLTINGLTQDYLFNDFDLNEPVGGAVHGLQFRLEAAVFSDRFALDRITARAYFSRPETNVQPQRFGGGDFDNDALAFEKQATLAGDLKFGGVYWLWKYMLRNGKLVNTSDPSDVNVVFQAGLQQGALVPTITGVERVDDGDELHWRAIVQFPQVGPTPIAPDLIRIKRRKGNTAKYKRVGELSVFGQDEFLAAGTAEVFVDFQTLDGVTDYQIIAILTTTSGEDRQSAPFAFSTNEKAAKTADPGPPSQPVINYTKWKKGHGAIARWTRPTTNSNSLHDYGIAAYFPAGAGPGSRTYINADTGAVLSVPTFGRGGNAEIFVGDTERFHGHALKRDLPAGAISGGIGFILRAYNFTLVSGVATETPSVIDANFPNLAEMGQITAVEIANDPASEDTAPASIVQNPNLSWGTKKGFKTTWKRPASNIESLRGYKVVYFNGSNFMDPHSGQLSVPNTEAGATIFVPDTHHTTHFKFSDLASQFQPGVQVKVTPVNIVLGVETDGTPWISSLVPPQTDDGLNNDTLAPTGLSTPVLVVPATGGLLAKQMRADNNNNTHRYTEVVFEIVDNLGNSITFLDPATGENVGPEVRTNIGRSGHLNIDPNRAVLFSLFPTRFIRSYFYVTNAVNTSLKSPVSNSVAISSLKDVSLKEDSGDPGLVDTLALGWTNRKGFKGTWKKPLTNSKSVNEFIVAYQSSNGQWMNPHTGQVAADETAATIRVRDTHHTTHLKFSELASAFRPPFTVTIRVKAVNTVNGAERIGAVNTASTSATSDDPLGEDTGFPNGGSAIAVNRVKLKKGGILIVDFVMPTINMNTYEKTVLRIYDNFGSFYDPFTNTWVSTYPDGSQELSFAQGGIPGLPIRRNELFVGGRTRVYVRVGIRNRFNSGSTQYSTDLAHFVDSSFVAGNPSEPDSVTEDTAIASAATSILLDWNTRKGAKLTFVKPTTNVNAQPIKSLIGFKVAYSDVSGSVWMNPVTGQTGVTEAAATVFITDTDHTTGLKRGQIGLSTIRAKVTPVTLVNGVETDGTSGFSNSLTVLSQVEIISNADRIITGLETDAVIPAKTLFGTHKNLIVGGACLNDASQFSGGGTADQLGKNWRANANNSASRINRLSAVSGLLWDRAGHRIQCANNTASQGGQPSSRMRRQVIPGEIYAFTMTFLGASVFFVSSISVDLVDDGAGSIIASQTLSSGFTAGLSWSILIAILSVPSGYQQNGQQWCRVRFGADFSNTLYLDNWCLVRNQQAALWSPSAEEESLDSSVTITTNTGVGNIGAACGGGNISLGGTGFSAGGAAIGVLVI